MKRVFKALRQLIHRIRLRRRIKKQKRLNRSLYGDIMLFLVLLLFGSFSAYPLVFNTFHAFKPLNEIFEFPPRLFVRNPTLANFVDLFNLMNESWVPFSRHIFNTIFITAVGTGGHVILASMAAYPLAKYQFPGKNFIFRTVVLSLMFVPTVTSISNYIILGRLGIIDRPLAVILPAFASSLGLYLMKQFMEAIPFELIESAKLDGASEFAIYRKIVMPLVRPAWLTLIILSFQSLWVTDGGLYIYSDKHKPVSYALNQLVSLTIAQRQGTMAAVTFIMMIVPVTVFIITRTKIIETMAHSGMK
ncbi:MAG TPA: carbohydrate ABC transporter permease [Haloplasmataceae bacterium]